MLARLPPQSASVGSKPAEPSRLRSEPGPTTMMDMMMTTIIIMAKLMMMMNIVIDYNYDMLMIMIIISPIHIAISKRLAWSLVA